MTRRALGWAAAALALAFLLVLAVPGRDRALALFAFMLFAGALALAALVAVLAGAPRAGDGALVADAPAHELRPADLESIEHDVRGVLAGGIADEHLRSLVRSIALARLARNHGIDLRRDAAAAERLLGDDAAWGLLSARRGQRLDRGVLAGVVDALERL